MKTIKYILTILIFVSSTTLLKAQIYEGAIALGKSKENISRGIVTDSQGNVYFTGIIKDKLDFSTSGNPVEFGPSGSNNASYIAKYSSDMKLVWLKGFTTVGGETVEAHQLSIDEDDNVYFAGGFKGELSCTPAEITGNSAANGSALFVKYDKDGNVKWYKVLGDLDPLKFQSIAADKDGNVYLGTAFLGTVDLGSGNTVNGELDRYNAFITKISDTGGFIWAKKVSSGADGKVDIKRIKTGLSGNIYIAGDFSGNSIQVEGGTATVSNGASDDMFISQLSSDGTVSWTRTVGGNGSDLAFDLAIDVDDNVHLAASVKSTGKLSVSKSSQGNYDDLSITNTGKNLGVWVKFDKKGDYKSYLTLGDGNNDAYIHSVAVDESGYAYIGGGASGTTKYTIGGTVQEIKGRGQCDIVLIMVSPEGDVVKYQRTGGNKNEWVSYGSINLDEKHDKLYLGVQTRSLNCNMGMKFNIHDTAPVTAGPENTYSTAFTKYSLMSFSPVSFQIRENEQYSGKIVVSGTSKGTITTTYQGTLPQGVAANVESNGSVIVSGRPVGQGITYLSLLSENKEDSEAIGYLASKRIKIEVVPGKNVIILTPPSSVCLGEEITLEGNVAGTWSGPGVSGNAFRSSVAGIGAHTIRLTYQGEYDEVILTVMESVGSDLTLNLSETEITSDFRDPIIGIATSTEQTGAEFTFSINDADFKKVKQQGLDNQFRFYDSDLLLGENIIYVKMKPLSGCAAESGIVKFAVVNVKEYVNPNPPVVNPGEEEKDEVRLGSNPITDGTLRIIGLPSTARFEARIYTSGGKVVRNDVLETDGTLNISSVSPGMYIVSIIQSATGRKVKGFKIIKQ